MKPLTLMNRIWLASRTALPVWVALEGLSILKGRKRFYVKRATLARLTGIRRTATLSRALGILERYDIISRRSKVRKLANGVTITRLQVQLKLAVARSAIHPHASAPHAKEHVALHSLKNSGAASAAAGHSGAHSAARNSGALPAPIPVGDRRGFARAHLPSEDRHSSSADAAGLAAACATASASPPGNADSEQRVDSSQEPSTQSTHEQAEGPAREQA